MQFWDWSIVGLYLLAAVGYGLYFTKKAARSTDDFFVAGRTLPWYIAGTSLVAATFSSDTPLWIAGMSRNLGISSNWFWWSLAIGQISTVFFFAKLWRRTQAVTDIEFIVQRYQPSKAASALRIFKVFNDGVLINCVIIASVVLAMSKILKVILNLSDNPVFTLPFWGAVTPSAVILIILCGGVLLYTVLSGMYGVAYLDTVQFVLAMIGSIVLAILVYVDISSGEGMISKLESSPEFKPQIIHFFPDLSTLSLPAFTFFVYISAVWWSQAPGGYFYVQRLLATRSEKDSVYAFLWYNICHYIVRTWPWVTVGIFSLYYFPVIQDPDEVYPRMIDMFLPVGLKGIMVASLLAAFMSTIDTQLNWGTSYLINDFYRPFIKKDASSKHYVLASRIAMVLLTMTAVLITTKLTGIFAAYKYVVVIMGGIGPVLILRWYWWRINAWSEISAIVATLIIANVIAILLPDAPGRELFSVRFMLTLVFVTPVWLILTLLTSKEPTERTVEFYKRLRVSGPGWRKVEEMTGLKSHSEEFKSNLVAWISCVFFIFSIMLGTGKLLFHEWIFGAFYWALALISVSVLAKTMKKIGKFMD